MLVSRRTDLAVHTKTRWRGTCFSSIAISARILIGRPVSRELTWVPRSRVCRSLLEPACETHSAPAGNDSCNDIQSPAVPLSAQVVKLKCL